MAWKLIELALTAWSVFDTSPSLKNVLESVNGVVSASIYVVPLLTSPNPAPAVLILKVRGPPLTHETWAVPPAMT